MKKIIVLILFSLICVSSYSQSEQEKRILTILRLKKQNEKNNLEIQKILKQDPELKKILSGVLKKDISTFNLFDEKKFEFELEKFISFLKENDIDRVEEILKKIQNSEKTKQIVDFLIFEMNKAKEKLKKEIEDIPKKY